MPADIVDPEPFIGIHSQYLGQHVLSIFGERFGHFVLSRQDLLVQFGSLWILEGQTATEHGIEYDPATPNIHHNRLVSVLPFDHLRGSVAGRSTGSLQPLIYLAWIVPFL